MYPWVDTTPSALKVADAIVACAIMKKNINPARIHSLGYSAGGLMASSLGTQRSSYMASIAAYSGGQTGTTRPTFDDPTNKISALLFHGGAMDAAGGTNFPMAAASYATALQANGGTAVVCNHNLGRSMPPEGPAAVWRFFQDHPYGRASPYAAMLPAGYPMGCMLQP
jgi:poly(3-hydroxybutyrate) depolymerase